MGTRSGRIAAIVALTALACGADRSAPSPQSPAPSSPSPAAPSKQLLVVTHTTAFRHSSIATAEAAIRDLGVQSGLYQVTFCRSADDVRRLLTAEALGSIDGVFFANTTGNLGIADLPAFLAWIRSGRAFLGAHSASDTYHDAPSYLDMLGGEFDRHGDETTVDAIVEDRSHPSTAHLGATFRMFDEIYEFKRIDRTALQVLLSLDRHPSDGHPAAGQPGDFPLAWHKRYGDGRVFYTAFGHREDVWENPQYRQHLLGAIRWALSP